MDASNVHAALAQANRTFHRMARRSQAELIDPAGRIDVADGHGNVVARLIYAEALAGVVPAAAQAEPRMTIIA